MYHFEIIVNEASGNNIRIIPALTVNAVSYGGMQNQMSYNVSLFIVELPMTAGQTAIPSVSANGGAATLLSGRGKTWWSGRLVG